jgi:hypothetical protein
MAFNLNDTIIREDNITSNFIIIETYLNFTIPELKKNDDDLLVETYTDYTIPELKKNIHPQYTQAEKIAALINQAASNPNLPEGDIYKKASDKYNDIMNDPDWENQINFGQVLATEQYNRNKFNEIVKELIGKVNGVDNTMYMCEVFDGAAKLVDDDPKISNLPERDADGDCDGKLE